MRVASSWPKHLLKAPSPVSTMMAGTKPQREFGGDNPCPKHCAEYENHYQRQSGGSTQDDKGSGNNQELFWAKVKKNKGEAEIISVFKYFNYWKEIEIRMSLEH